MCEQYITTITNSFILLVYYKSALLHVNMECLKCGSQEILNLKFDLVVITYKIILTSFRSIYKIQKEAYLMQVSELVK